MQIGSLAAFAIFVALGVRVLTSAAERRRRAINHLLAYTLGVHAFLLIAQKDAWPFSVYPMMAAVSRNRSDQHQMIVARGVDAQGREWPVDPIAWSPLYPSSTLAWFDVGYPSASAAERQSVMRFLLERAEKARRQRAAGEAFIGNRALLGPLAAPDTNLYGAVSPAPMPFRALRIYRVFWNPTAFARDPSRVTRKLLCEYRS